MFIYGLIDPNSFLVRYIGRASNIERPYSHYKNVDQDDKATHKINWIRSLGDVVYDATVLEYCSTVENCIAAEMWWIAYGRCLGWPLTNATDGGEGWRGKHTPETKQKISDALKGRLPSQETRDKLSVARLGNTNAVGSRGPYGELAGNTHLTWDDVDEIRRRVAIGERRRDVRKEFGIAHATLGKIIRGETW